MIKLLALLFATTIISNTTMLLAQTAGDYRSVTTGLWRVASTWQRYSGTTWVGATTPPSFTDGKISIRVGHTVTSDSIAKADQVVIDSGGTLHLVVATGTSTLTLHNGAGFDLVCNGSLIVDANTILERETGLETIEYKNATLSNSGGISPEITFDGNVAQKVIGSGYNGAIILNNSKNLEITGTQSYGSVNFINGKILVTGNGNFVATEYGKTFTGQSTSRFIDGKVDCIIYTGVPITFSLPLGKGNEYLPVVFTVKQDTGTSPSIETHFIFTIKDSAPATRTLPSSLSRVSSVRYFNIVRQASASTILSASLQLPYTANDGVSDTLKLRVARGVGTQWVNLGGTGKGLPVGDITTTANFTSFGDFVLANAVGGGNTLPLHITAFDAAIKGNSVLLQWSAENQSDISHFILERNNGKDNWEQLTIINKHTDAVYSYTDKTNHGSTTYQYRLKEVYKDSHWSYSKIVAVKFADNVAMHIEAMYPNPATTILHYTVASAKDDNIDVKVTDMRGRLLIIKKATCNQPEILEISKLQRATYFLTIVNKRTGENLVKEIAKE
jgi:hypothetical protein